MKRETAEHEAHQQHLARADMVGEVARRSLCQAGNDAEHGQREAKFDIADAELCPQEGKQHRKHQQMEMADPMGGRNQHQRAQRGLRLRVLLRCGENVDHRVRKPRLNERPGRARPKIPFAGYLSMNTGAWQPSAGAPRIP